MAALALSAQTQGNKAVTITGSAFTATSPFRLQIFDPTGGSTFRDVLSDGSGAFTTSYLPQGLGPLTVTARPVAEFTGSTAAQATATMTIVLHPKS
jgi:hypothetical protein